MNHGIEDGVCFQGRGEWNGGVGDGVGGVRHSEKSREKLFLKEDWEIL